jgi:hypothetical protein
VKGTCTSASPRLSHPRSLTRTTCVSHYDPHLLALFFRPRSALRIPEAVFSVVAGDVLRKDRRRLFARFRALQGLAKLQRLGAGFGRPLVPPLADTPAGTR